MAPPVDRGLADAIATVTLWLRDGLSTTEARKLLVDRLNACKTKEEEEELVFGFATLAMVVALGWETDTRTPAYELIQRITLFANPRDD